MLEKKLLTLPRKFCGKFCGFGINNKIGVSWDSPPFFERRSGGG
jgi:hypothetical protein